MVHSSRRVLIQGVYELYETEPTTEWAQDEPRINRLVFIGKYTHKHQYRHVLQAFPIYLLRAGYNLNKKELQRTFESVIL